MMGRLSLLLPIVASITVAAALTACGPKRPDYASLELLPVSGLVTLNRAPLAGAQVIFEAPDGTYSYGRTDAEGRYELQFNSEARGTLPGEKTVRIWTARRGIEFATEAPPGETDLEELIPAQYNEASELHVHVTDQQRTFDFALQSSP